jgi:hypothetical protein
LIIGNATNLPVMPRAVRERAKIPAMYDPSLIQKIRLPLKPFACMPSIVGGERM